MKKLSPENAVYLNSEALKMINYDKEKHVLEATFSNNKTYQYIGVSIRLWKNFLSVINSGSSAGAFINKEIKPFHKYIEV